MKTHKFEALLLALLLPACGKPLVEFVTPGAADAGRADGGSYEVRNIDGEPADARVPDGASPDVVGMDTRNPDTRNVDGAGSDVTASDALRIDANNLDVMKNDAGDASSRTPDVASPDGGAFEVRDTSAADTIIASIDAASIDAPTIDAPTMDGASIDSADLDAGDLDAQDIDAQPTFAINLGAAATFAIAATAGITNTMTTPVTRINGDVVLEPNQTCNAVAVDNAGGFGLCGGMPPVISGTVITNLYPDATTAGTIKSSLNAAFLSITPLAGPPAVGSLAGGTPIAAPTTLGAPAGNPLVLGQNWFTPGVYTSITSILIGGDVTLDGQGDPNAQFIFQSASTLTTADGAPNPGAHARILLTNGAKASNVWWQVASSATIGSYAEFRGNILAAFNITMKTGATACGRSMAGAWVGGAGALVFDANVVSVPGNGCPL
jgi:hypothetical protein